MNPRDPRLGYVRLPGGRSHKEQHRRGLFTLHLGRSNPARSQRIAAHHFRAGEFANGTLAQTTSSRDHAQYPSYNDSDLCSVITPGAQGYYNVPNVSRTQFAADASNHRDLPPPGGGSPSLVHRPVSTASRRRVSDINELERNFDAGKYLDSQNAMQSKINALQAELKEKEQTVVDLTERYEALYLSAEKDAAAMRRLLHLADACDWAHGRANLQQPLLKPLNWGAYLASLHK
jgi:hypothetical protein